MRKNEKTKVLFFIKDPNGGTGRFIEQIERILMKKRRFEIQTCVHITPKGFFLRAKRIGIPFEKQKKFSIINLAISICNLLAFYKQVRLYKPDIVFSLDIFANSITAITRIFFPKTKFIQSTHVNLSAHIDNNRERTFGALLKFIIKFLYKNSDSHYVPSQGLREQLINEFGIPRRKIIYIPYPLDLSHVTGLSNESIGKEKIRTEITSSKYIKIFTICRFENQKNFYLLLESFKLASNKNNRLKLYILGSGSLEKEIRRLIRDLDLEENTHLLGWQRNPYKFLRYADIFVFLSNYEGMPYVLLEARALNIFQIASDVDFGPREIIDSSSGYLIKNKNPKQIANLICKAISSEAYKKIDRKQAYEKGTQEYKRIKGMFIQYFEGMRQHYRMT